MGFFGNPTNSNFGIWPFGKQGLYSPQSVDPDAKKYFNSAGITDPVEICAGNNLAKDLKGTGNTTNNSNIFSLIDALYPISPGLKYFGYGSYAVDLDGTTQKVTAGTPMTLGSDGSISLWFNIAFSGFETFIGNTASSNVQVRTLGTTSIQYFDGVGTSFSFSAISANQWHHLVLSRSGGDLTMYVDGVASSSGAQAVSDIVFNEFGAYSNGFADALDGSLDEISVYDYALSGAQVSQLYNSGDGASATSLSPTAYWKFNENEGLTVADEVGSNDLTLVGSPSWIPHFKASLDAASYNFVDPSAYQITWNNMTDGDVSALGVTGNGTNKWGYTGITAGDIPSGSNHMAATVQAASGGVSDDLIGLGSSPFFYVLRGLGTGDTQTFLGAGAGPLNFGSDVGVMIGSRVAASGAGATQAYLNGANVDSSSTAEATPASSSAPLTLFRIPSTNYSSATAGNFAFGDGLTAAQAQDLSDALAKHRASLQTGVCITDIDLAYYIIKGGITDTTETEGLVDLVSGLKSSGLWAKSYAIYPISPTSLAAAALDLKGTYGITWYNTPTHASTGVSGNGTTQYGDTGFNPSTQAAVGNYGYTVSAGMVGSDWANGSAGGGFFTGASGFTNDLVYNGPNSPISGNATSTTKRVITSSRRSTTDHEAYSNGVSVGSDATLATGLPNLSNYVLARNLAGSPSGYLAQEMNFYVEHQGLTDDEVSTLYDLITAYNTSVR
jgi:hypothetical protein